MSIYTCQRCRVVSDREVPDPPPPSLEEVCGVCGALNLDDAGKPIRTTFKLTVLGMNPV